MELADLFERAEIIERHVKRAKRNTNTRVYKQNPHKIENPEDLSPEAFRYYAKESTGVAQHVSVRMTSKNTFMYISHSKFR